MRFSFDVRFWPHFGNGKIRKTAKISVPGFALKITKKPHTYENFSEKKIFRPKNFFGHIFIFFLMGKVGFGGFWVSEVPKLKIGFGHFFSFIGWELSLKMVKNGHFWPFLPRNCEFFFSERVKIFFSPLFHLLGMFKAGFGWFPTL